MKSQTFYDVRYNLPSCPPPPAEQYPVLAGCVFRFLENAFAHSLEHKGSSVHMIDGAAYGLTVNDFKGEAYPPARRARGGKLARQIRKNLTGARWTKPKRKRGPSPSSGGLFMRPPGSGAVDYIGQFRAGVV